MLIQLKKNYLLLWVLRVVMVPIVLILYAAGLVLQLLFGLCTAVGTLLSGLGGIAAVLALLDHCYAEAAASALVALLVCHYGVPQLLFWAGGILLAAATALYTCLYRM